MSCACVTNNNNNNNNNKNKSTNLVLTDIASTLVQNFVSVYDLSVCYRFFPPCDLSNNHTHADATRHGCGVFLKVPLFPSIHALQQKQNQTLEKERESERETETETERH